MRPIHELRPLWLRYLHIPAGKRSIALERDADGQPNLVQTDFRTDRSVRRPPTEDTATVIVSQKTLACEWFCDTGGPLRNWVVRGAGIDPREPLARNRPRRIAPVTSSDSGITGPKPLPETTANDRDVQHDVMAHGSFLVSREAARLMLSQDMGGDIIYIASTNAVGPDIAYSVPRADQAHQVRLALTTGDLSQNIALADAGVASAFLR